MTTSPQPPSSPQPYSNYHQQPPSNPNITSAHYDPNMLYNTYNGHESMVDPNRDINQGTGVSRQTFIGIYIFNHFNFFSSKFI